MRDAHPLLERRGQPASRRRTRRLVVAGLLALATTFPSAPPCEAQARMPSVGSVDTQQGALPEELREVGFEQRLGETVPLQLGVRDEQGNSVQLGSLFADKPVILVPAYYECPMLCTMVINDLTSALRVVPLKPGTDFEVIVYSINPDETPKMALTTKNTTVARYDGGDGEGWHFLTASQESIDQLSEAIGFHYYYDEKSGEYAHTAGILVITPDGKIARYFFGLQYPPRELRLAMVEAADEKIGSLADKLLLFCFQWNPSTGRYSAVTLKIIRLGGALTLAGILLMVTFLIRRERKHNQPALGTT